MPRSQTVANLALLVSAVLSAPLPAVAQSPSGSMRSQLTAIGGPLGSEQAMAAMAQWVGIEVSTAPLGTSTGGFTWTLDPFLRVDTRSSQSYGPAFAERSLTTGRHKFSAGLNFLPATYTSFNGQRLDGGEFQPARRITGFTPLPTASHSSLDLDLSSRTTVVYGHVGLTDYLDVGLAIPWTRVSMSARGGIISNTGTNLAASSIPAAAASGIGDVGIFGKYRFLRQPEGGLALAVELRLPSGDPDAFRGLGVTRALVSGIWSRGGRLSPHVNVGYEFWSDAVALAADNSIRVRDQWRYAAGVELAAAGTATVVVDLLGRHLRGGSVAYETFRGPIGSSIEALAASRDGVHRTMLAPGVKWNVWESTLITASLLAPISDAGLRVAPMAVIGLDWAF